MRSEVRPVVTSLVRGLALVASLCSGGAAIVGAQSETGASAGGIARLTAATRQEAVECGNAGAPCALAPYDVCPQEASRYAVRLITPFSRVASAALEAKINAQPLGRMGPGAVNQWGVALYVAPAQRSAAAEGIRRVEIRRDDGNVIQPKWTTVGPITTTIGDGVTRPLSRGFFLFPIETFTPSASLTIVFVGEAGETTCTVDQHQLALLR
jgi:hypothetical protein